MRIGSEKYVLKSKDGSVIWVPKKPGLWIVEGEITIDTGFKTITLRASREVRVKPMPTRVEIKRGSIVIDVYDLLGRRANGTVFVEIRDLKGKLLYKNSYSYDEKRVVIIEIEGVEWVYVYVVYRSNGSYADSWKMTVLSLEPLENRHWRLIPVVSEPPLTLIIFITSIIAIATIRRRSRRTD